MELDVMAIDTRAGLLYWNLDYAAQRSKVLIPPADIRDLIRYRDLPLLPPIAQKLFELQNNPDADVLTLTNIVELDPLVASQIVRWANSAYYGLRRSVTSVRDAIVRALGYDLTLNLALALTALNPLQTPNEGPLARDAIWYHGIQCGRLMQELANHHLTGPICESPGLIYLAGMTQNIGYLLLGHLLPKQYKILNRLIDSNSSLTLPTIDRFVLGVEHTQLGLWLFDVWNMHRALRSVVRHHHNPAYCGEHERLVLLTCLADSLLFDSPWNLGAKPIGCDLDIICDRLGIDYDSCNEALSSILSPESKIDGLNQSIEFTLHSTLSK